MNFTGESLGTVHQGAWLVYVNGLQIPAQSVGVSYGVWQIPQATFSVPSHRALQRLGNEDRVEVVIFYLDDLADPDNPEFKLLFEGEITGWSWTNSPAGRQMQFNCIADISIFTRLFFHFLNTVDAILGSTVPPEVSANSIQEAGVFYPFSLFKKGLTTSHAADKDKVPDITAPFEILYNVVKGMTSNKISTRQRTVPAVNFFSRWARKRNFVNRFAALPIFEDEKGDDSKGVFPILDAAQADFALKSIQQQLSATVGEAGSLFAVLQQTFGVVYHELAMIPTAPCFRVRLEDGSILGPASTPPSSPERVNKEPLRILNYFVKPQMLFGIAPSCNVVFPSMVTSSQYREDYDSQPTRTYLNDQFLTSMLQQNVFTSASLTVGWPMEINAVLAQKGGQADAATASDVVQNGKNVLVWPEEFFRGPSVARAPIPSWFTYLKNKESANKPEAAEGAQSNRLASLFEGYAKYEHARGRYEKRGGAVDMVFNPYIVPGFPCVLFDQRESGMDFAGYVMNVSHSMSSGSMTTNISYGFARTIQEVLEGMLSDSALLGRTLGSFPAEPVDSIRDVCQVPEEAERFYNALFHGRREDEKAASFDIRDVMGMLNPKKDIYEPDAVEPITFENGTNIDPDRDLEPLKGFEGAFSSYDDAMRYVARPICTLREYVSFLHGGVPVSALLQEGLIEGADNQYAYDDPGPGEITSAVFFKRIRRLRQGPGDVPSPAERGATVTVDSAAPYTGSPSGVSADFAQTRADWDRALEQYRSDFYDELAPQW